MMWGLNETPFEHPKHMFQLMAKKVITVLLSKILLNWNYDIWFCFSGCHENPELIWNDESREKVSGEVKDMKNRYFLIALRIALRSPKGPKVGGEGVKLKYPH